MTVDFSNLREFTDGDSDLEKDLFEEYIASSTGLLAELRKALNADAEKWRKEAHAFKGISLNLGANHLGELCLKAQEFKGNDSERQALLSEIEKVHAEVIAAVRAEMQRIGTA